MRKIRRTDDNSIINEAGEFLFVSQGRFLETVVRGGACFICTLPIEYEAKEHIIPKWLQRHVGIFQETITLPNLSRYRYDQYTVPCCSKCNAALGKVLEAPISQAICGGYESFSTFARSNSNLLFAWLNLIVFKTHLKDLSLREVKDLRVESGVIAERYNWLDFHHAHAIARAPLYDIEISAEAIGTIMTFPIADFEKSGNFDYRDHWPTDTVFLRIHEIGIVSVLNDSGKVAEMAIPRVPLDAPPNVIQAAEILTEFQAASAHLLNRPTFATFADTETGYCSIEAIIPEEVEIKDFSVELFGEIFWMNLQPFIRNRNQDGVLLFDQEEDIKAGRVTFLPLKMKNDTPTA